MLEHRDIEHLDIPELSQPKNFLGKWSSFFIDRYRVVFLIILAIMIIGASSYVDLPRELSPEITLPYGNVMTVYSGAAPDEIETLVTDKIESKLEDLEDVKDMTSYSSFGYSLVWIEFEQGVDVDKKIEEMRDELSGIESELPEDAESPVVDSLKTNNTPIMIVNVSGDYDLIELTNIAEKLKDRLELEPDVLEALIIGGIDREIKIVVDPQKLAVYGITLEQIQNAIAGSNVNFPGGDIVLDERNYNIRTVGELETVDQLNRVVVLYQDSGPLYLSDIATIEDGYEDAESYSRLSVGLDSSEPNMKRSVSISVKKKESADIIETSGLVRELLEEERGTTYPEDLEVQISGDTAKFVRDSLGAVTNNALSGLYLVLIVLFLFIGFGEAVIVSAVIPLAILTALWLMKINDMSFNTITLFSLVLAVGMLVDNGIVIMENIDRLRFKGLNSVTAAEVGTNQIAPAVAAATLTTLAAFFPIMLTPGIMGAYIKAIPLTVMFTLIASFFVAMTVTPALCSVMLKKHRSEVVVDHRSPKTIALKIIGVLFIIVLALAAFAEDGKVGLLSIIFAVLFGGMMIAKQFMGDKKLEDSMLIKTYGATLHKIVSKRSLRWMVVAVVSVAFLSSIALPVLGILKVEMFASSDNDRLYINIETPNGTPLEVTNDIASEIEMILFQYPEIEAFVSNVGITGADSFDDFSVNSGNPTIGRIVVDLLLEEDRERSSMELAEDMREKLAHIAGADIEVEELEDGPPSDSPVAIDIMGENLEDLEKVAMDFEEILRGISGTRDVSTTVSEGDPELQIRVDKERAARYGLNDRLVAVSIRNAINGLKATTYRENQDEIDVIIKTSDERLKTKTDIERLYFYNSQGQPIEFNQVARLVETTGYTTIVHEETKRRVSVFSEVNEGVNAAEITTLFNEMVADYPLPEGISIEQGGEMGDIQDTFKDMFINMAVAAILVYLILAVQFNSLTQPFIILCTVPMALIGVMYGLLITGYNFGFVSFVGVVALVGIAVNDAIVLVDYINYLRKNGYELYDAVKETGITRFIPVMATTITTAGGILPITLKQEFFAPMGYALIFGLMMATVLTLVVVPVMYTMLEERKMKKLERKRMKKQKKFWSKKKSKGGVVIEKDSHVAYNR